MRPGGASGGGAGAAVADLCRVSPQLLLDRGHVGQSSPVVQPYPAIGQPADVPKPNTAAGDHGGPFPTALLAAQYGTADHTLAVAVFNGTYVLIAIFFNVLWHHAVRAGLLDPATQESADVISRQYAKGPVASLASFALGWVSVPASLILNIGLALFFVIPPRTRSGRRVGS